MGARSSKTIPYSSDFNISEWINENYTTNDTGVLEYGKMRTLKNRNTDQLVDKYENAFISSKDYEDYVKSFQWRRHQNYIVRAYHIVTKNSTKYCSNTYHHPKNRLSDFSDIPFPDTLYCLRAMLTGYAKLYNNVGAFPVREQQVCIDQKGNVRVWLNKDLSKNFPEQWEIQPKIRSDDQEQEDMVNEIVEIVARNSDTQLQPNPTFISFFQKNRSTQKLGFDQTLMLIEEYAQINNQVVPNYFASVLQVYENQDDLYQLQGGDEVNESLTHQPNINNAFGEFGEITEREIRKNSIQGSRADRETIKSKRSKQSRSSQIDRLEKHTNKPTGHNYNQVDSSRHSNRNVGETYRLSNLSKLDDEDKKQMVTGQRQSGQYTFPHLMNNYGNPTQNVSYRQSDQSNANQSQISYQSNMKNQTPVWLSLKPQQPYIPSSQAYLQMQNLGGHNQAKKYLNQFNFPTVRTQQTQRQNQILEASSNRLRQNYSISQKAQQNNLSMDRSKQRGIHLDEKINERFEKQLEEQLLRDKLEQQARQRSMRSNKIKGSYASEKPKFNNPEHHYSNFENSGNNLLHNDNSAALGSRQGSSPQLNEISNQPNTAQFIHGNSESNYRSLHHNSSMSHLGGLTKASSQRGFTIVIKPNSNTLNQSMAPAIPFSNFNNIGSSQQPTHMLKNHSQPYFPIQPIYQQNFYPLPSSPHNSPRIAQNSLNYNTSYKNGVFPQNFGSAVEKRDQNKKANKENNSKNIQTFYCTVADQVPLDPEIANDMLIYTSD